MADWDGNESGYTVTAPNGWEISYTPKPRAYFIDGEKVDASITEVLRCLDKPALGGWYERCGIAAMLQLHLLGITADVLLQGKPEDMSFVDWARLIDKGPVTDHKLRAIDVRDVASTRGQTVHDAFSYWATTGEMPDPHTYPEHEWGYVIALVSFLRAMPTLVPGGIECAVGSKEHSYAGRYDLRAATDEPHRVVTKVYPKSAPKTLSVPPGTFLIDLKTSVDVFPEHSLQLGGYEMASIESGYEPTDGQLVVQLGSDERYQCRRSHATGEDFLAVKGCWEALNRARAELKVAFR